MKLSLVVTEGKLVGKEIPVRLSQFLIGRDPECHLRPSSPLVSKRHCAVLVREGKAFLRDFESTNGTLLNSAPLKGEVEVREGDVFKVGPISFRIKMEATVVDKPGETPIPTTTAKTPAPVKSSSSRVDEDSVLEMLLMEQGEGGTPYTGPDPIPPGSTVMEIANLSEPGQEGQKPEEAGKKTSKKIADTKATSDAAKAILDKYMRRPRT
jgi:pSer/pThr/pTyr-binding forkhead associated (FHA) protein